MPRLSSTAPDAAAEPLQPPAQQVGQVPSSTPSACLSSGCVKLNVGGVLFTTSRATLEDSQPQSMLAALVSGHDSPRGIGEGGKEVVGLSIVVIARTS